MTNYKTTSLAAKKLTLCTLYCPEEKNPLDQAMVVYFPKPNSFTGEDVVEFHTHGGLAVTRKIISSLGKLPDFRMAERGEFARRAFLNFKMDLVEAEGLADLIDAETEVQRKFAYSQLTVI